MDLLLNLADLLVEVLYRPRPRLLQHLRPLQTPLLYRRLVRPQLLLPPPMKCERVLLPTTRLHLLSPPAFLSGWVVLLLVRRLRLHSRLILLSLPELGVEVGQKIFRIFMGFSGVLFPDVLQLGVHGWLGWCAVVGEIALCFDSGLAWILGFVWMVAVHVDFFLFLIQSLQYFLYLVVYLLQIPHLLASHLPKLCIRVLESAPVRLRRRFVEEGPSTVRTGPVVFIY